MGEKKLNILMMIHRQADSSPYCFFVHEQAKALRALGHQVTVVSAVGVTPMMDRMRPAKAEIARRTPERACVDGIDVYYPRYLTLGNAGERALGGRLLYLAALPVARRLHRERPFDVVHAHMLPIDGHAGLLTAKALKLPFVLTVHGTDVMRYFVPEKTPWRRNRAIARRADALLAVSSRLMSLVAPYRGEGKLTRIVPNGVDLSLVPLYTQNRPRSVISVSTLKAQKCVDVTLEAFARTAGDYPDATLTIVGVGEMETQLRARIVQLGLEARVTMTGGLPHGEVMQRMAQSDLFVMPSRNEGYGVVYIEAMSAGCIAVGSLCGGIVDTIENGVNGFLVPAGDTDAVEQVMRSVFARREKFADLRKRGRETARALTWENNAAAMTGIYREVIAGYAGRR